MRYYCYKCDEWVRFSDEYLHDRKHSDEFYYQDGWFNLRAKVLKRDNYTCTYCGTKDKILHVHHIKPRTKYPKLEYKAYNCEVLCEDCHKKIHPHLEKLEC